MAGHAARRQPATLPQRIILRACAEAGTRPADLAAESRRKGAAVATRDQLGLLDRRSRSGRVPSPDLPARPDRGRCSARRAPSRPCARPRPPDGRRRRERAASTTPSVSGSRSGGDALGAGGAVADGSCNEASWRRIACSRSPGNWLPGSTASSSTSVCRAFLPDAVERVGLTAASIQRQRHQLAARGARRNGCSRTSALELRHDAGMVTERQLGLYALLTAA